MEIERHIFRTKMHFLLNARASRDQTTQKAAIVIEDAIKRDVVNCSEAIDICKAVNESKIKDLLEDIAKIDAEIHKSLLDHLG